MEQYYLPSGSRFKPKCKPVLNTQRGGKEYVNNSIKLKKSFVMEVMLSQKTLMAFGEIYDSAEQGLNNLGL